ncbi:MAG: hypothetical protein AB9835_11540 [Eubacteriales bacterium]
MRDDTTFTAIFNLYLGNMKFELIHLDNYFIISNFIYNLDDAANGNPYNTSFKLLVKSGVFLGIGECEYDIKEFLRFSQEINDLYLFNRNKVIMHDIFFGSYVEFNMDITGHLLISGEIYGDARIHSMKFEFLSDQTALRSFNNSLTNFYNIIK